MTKLAILSGATMGIGKLIALDLARYHYDLVLLTHNKRPAQQLQTTVRSMGQECDYYPCRVENAPEITQAFGQIKNRCGQIDLVFTNMGVMPDQPAFPAKKVGELTAQIWQQIFFPSVMGIVNSASHAIQAFQGNPRGGKIINCAFYGNQPQVGRALYLASRRVAQAIDQTVKLEYDNIQTCLLTAPADPLQHVQQILDQLDQFLTQ